MNRRGEKKKRGRKEKKKIRSSEDSDAERNWKLELTSAPHIPWFLDHGKKGIDHIFTAR